MNREELLTLFDDQMRRDPPLDPAMRSEWNGPVLLVIGEDVYVSYADLRNTDVTNEVAIQTAKLRSLGLRAEWKVYGHDFPPELGGLLGRAGFVPDPPETLMVFDLTKGTPESTGPASGIDVRQVSDRAGLVDAAEAGEKTPDEPEGIQPVAFESRLGNPTMAFFVAYVEGRAVSAGRLEMPRNRAFASLWGGSTKPSYRHRGIYRTLVRVRAEKARERGFRYLTVDARETSRPILERLRFSAVTSIRGWVLKPTSHLENP